MSSPEEFQLPSAVVQRIVKAALPDNIQIAKDAKFAISTAGKIFINYLTACANDLCMNSNRSTISGGDVLDAIEDLEFPELLPALREFLKAAKIEQATKQNEKKERKAGETANDKENEDEEEEDEEDEDEQDEVDQDKSKDNEKTKEKDKSKDKGKQKEKSKKDKGKSKGVGRGKATQKGKNGDKGKAKEKEEDIDDE